MHCAYHAAGHCRSCTELLVPYADQLAAKDRHARSLLAAHASVEWLPPVPSRQRGFRNKAKMVVGGSIEQPVLGILGEAGQTTDLSQCPLYPASMQAAFGPIADFVRTAALEPYNLQTRRGELKYVLLTEAEHSGELMLRWVLRSQALVARIRKYLPQLLAALPKLRVASVNVQPVHQAILEGEQEIVLTESAALPLRINGLPLYLRPRSFFQTNTEVASRLYQRAADWANELQPASVWDLFCGVGGFALHCASAQRDVTGIELSAEAIASAEQSSAELKLTRVHFRALGAQEFALANAEVAELVIVNPPRRGIGDELCRFLDRSEAKALVYSSCNAESLARDLAAMPNFRLRSAQVLDMFPHSRHFEVITLLERG